MAVGWVGFALLPWYGIEDGFFGLPGCSTATRSTANSRRRWSWPSRAKNCGCAAGFLLAAPLLLWGRNKSDPFFGRLLVIVGAAGFGWLLFQGFAIGLHGWQFSWLTSLFGDLGDRQFGMGYGALLVSGAFLFLLTLGIAARGAVGGDVFVVSSSASSSRWFPSSSSCRS